jgi:hypothetical protein
MEKIHQFSLSLKEYFNERAEAIAVKTGFIKRKRKLTGASFVKAMIFGHLEGGKCTIENLCEILQQEEINITKQGIDFRFNKAAVKLLETMYHEALQLFKNTLTINCNILECFNSVKLLDSSYISLPPVWRRITKAIHRITQVKHLKQNQD